MTNWFISDTHFSHKNIIQYYNRPFKSIITMNEALINNINNCVGENDILWHLGDWAFGQDTSQDSIIYTRSHIHCRNIVLIMGNHDKLIIKKASLRSLFMMVMPFFVGYINTRPFALNHYPLESEERVSTKSVLEFWIKHKNATFLFGHSHNLNTDKHNISVENQNYKPIHIDKIK